VLGDSNIIFFINVLQESIFTVRCVVFEGAFVNQPSIIIADEPDPVLDTWNSNIIPEYTLPAEQSVKTENKFCPIKNGRKILPDHFHERQEDYF
jgi:hypothetical protein